MTESTTSRKIVRLPAFERWFGKLRDARARFAIDQRLNRLRKGNFGDVRGMGDRVSELRIDTGPGYRVYFTIVGDAIIVLLCAGDKTSQPRDIALAKTLAATAEEIVNGR
ncbi:MAG: type II toxin-antitoxin system RelE/ParE family toxin [Devosia sp.]|nr:type II toxin-antitoxin system RelE/ParE family toxin [Devosia sp.]